MIQAELDQILLSRHHYAILNLTAGPFVKARDVGAAVSMVIRIDAEGLQTSPQVRQRPTEAFRVSDSTKGGHRLIYEQLRQAFCALNRKELAGPVYGLDQRHARRIAAHRAAKL